MFYILNQPHWGWYIAVILMFAFWIPLTYPFYWGIQDGDEDVEAGFNGMFIYPRYTFQRKFIRAIFNSTIHLVI